ncbi:hypothetical protein H0H92_007630, partial [Tricholoma furcatifolium]
MRFSSKPCIGRSTSELKLARDRNFQTSLLASAVDKSTAGNITATILAHAAAGTSSDNINLSVLSNLDTILADISAVYANASIARNKAVTGNKRAVFSPIIDVH